MQKSLKFIFTFIVVAICMPLVAASIREIGKYIGVVSVSVPVIGTGSMYPSLFWESTEGGPDNSEQKVVEEYRTNPHMYRFFPGFDLFGKSYLKRDLALGDLVTFESVTTRAILSKEGEATNVGFIKRIVALPGDTVELRDGYFLRNGQPVDEPYIYRPRSTYGDTTLPDCQPLTVPPHKYFVLGDNRKISADSRGELGLVDRSDITFVLPYPEQTLYHSLWRDTSQDANLSGTPTLNSQEFYQLVNEARNSANLSTLRPNTALAKSASRKAGQILAGNPDYPLADAVAFGGYQNPLIDEFSVRGRFTAQELVDNIMYFASSRETLLDSRFQDIGLSTLNQEVNGCPTEVTVIDLGGYVPAEYEQGVVDSWRSLRDNLDSVIPTWEKAIDNQNVDQINLQELLTILRRRLTLAREITHAMENKDWLTDSQQARIESDKIDAERAAKLSNELNNRN